MRRADGTPLRRCKAMLCIGFRQRTRGQLVRAADLPIAPCCQADHWIQTSISYLGRRVQQ